MTEFDRDYCLALADCLDKPEAPDGTFVGLSDSALIVKALRMLAMGGGPVEPRMPGAAPGGVPDAISTRPATSGASAETGLHAGV